MKHISDILKNREASLFAKRTEKGSREWAAFNAVQDDRIEMFPIHSPRAYNTPRYTNLVPIRRLKPQFGH